MRSLTPLGHRETQLDGRVVTYVLKRSPRARYVRLEIREGQGLTVVVPRRYDLRRLDELLRRRTSWILRKLEPEPRCGDDRGQGVLCSGDSIRYLGRELRVMITEGERDQSCTTMKKDKLLIVRPRHPDSSSDLLERWFRDQAARFLHQRVELLGSQLGVRHGRITIRGQKTRWASCSAKADLSFNWRLMMAPEAVIDYVIIHELTHLREMNHTAGFWKLVAERCPTWKENRRWLKIHGAQLSATSVKLA